MKKIVLILFIVFFISPFVYADDIACPYCGAKNSSEDAYCISCTKQISEVKVVETNSEVSKKEKKEKKKVSMYGGNKKENHYFMIGTFRQLCWGQGPTSRLHHDSTRTLWGETIELYNKNQSDEKHYIGPVATNKISYGFHNDKSFVFVHINPTNMYLNYHVNCIYEYLTEKFGKSENIDGPFDPYHKWTGRNVVIILYQDGNVTVFHKDFYELLQKKIKEYARGDL